jgi:recombination protein RecR
MIDNIPSFKHLLRHLQQVPYLASKNIYRVAHYFLSLDAVKADQFCKAILDAKNNIAPCKYCFAWKEKEGSCAFCDSAKRDAQVICVVETWQELITIEKTGGYNGLYHILGGAISPLDDIGPEDLTINELLDRINEKVQEVILATNQTPVGEATAAFIANKLKESPVKVSCLARGIPVGSPLEFMDRVTIYKALTERRPF